MMAVIPHKHMQANSGAIEINMF